MKGSKGDLRTKTKMFAPADSGPTLDGAAADSGLTLDRAAADSGLTLDGAAANYHYLPLIAIISGESVSKKGSGIGK